MIAVFAFLVAWTPFVLYLSFDPALALCKRLDNPFVSNVAHPLFMLFAVLVFPTACGVWVMRRAVNRLGLRCPHCRHELWDASDVVIATRNCPKCGRQVFESSDAADGEVIEHPN